MASTVTFFSNKIDINYPVVGQDNSTQGFRDNFSAIQSAFAVISSEVSDLQDNGVKLTETNDFGYNTIKNVTFQNVGETVKIHNLETVSTSFAYVSLDYTEASYHKCLLTLDASNTGTYDFTVVNWPDSGIYGRLYLEIKPDSTSTATISILGDTKIIGYTTVTSITYNQTATIFYELWTTDNGSTIFGTLTTG